MPSRAVQLAAVTCILVLLAAFDRNAAFAAPTIRNVSLRGLQAGGTTTLVIDGADLLPSPRLMIAAPITKQELKPTSTAARLEIDVTVDPKAEPGLYNLWLTTPRGVTERFIIAVDGLPQKPLTPQVDALPAALHGAISGSGVIETSFSGKAGQRVIVEVESQRIGSKPQPVIHLIDAAGREMAMALPTPLLRGDARLIASLSSDGVYKVRVHDLQYAASGPVRLKIGDFPFADLAFPSAVRRGQAAKLLLIGSMQGDARVDLAAADARPIVPAPWLSVPLLSGPRPAVVITEQMELVEDEAAASPRDLAANKAPFAVSGRLAKPGEEDRYKISVSPDQTYRFEVIADRIGSPIDGVLQLRNTKGDVIATNDDAGSPDPRLDFKIPAGADSVVACIRDAHGRGGEACIYRLNVTLATDPSPRTDFDLVIDNDSATVATGAPQLLKVSARRRGYDGPIRLRFDRLPGGATVTGGEIPAGGTAALLALTRNAGPVDGSAVITAVIGEGGDISKPMIRVAALEQHPLGDLQPWLRHEILLAPVEPTDIAFTADYGAVPADRKLAVGMKAVVPVQCVRPIGFDGPVRFTLLTNQATPLDKAGKPDTNSALRPEAAKIEIPADAKAVAAFDAKIAAEKTLAAAKLANEAANAKKPDTEPKLKQATDALAAADKAAIEAAAKAKNSIDVMLLVPPNLPEQSYELAFRAELLSRDSKNVLAIYFTPVKRLAAINPIVVKLSSPPRVEVKLDAKAGAVVAWAGTIERREGAAGEVTVSLDDPPKGVTAPKVVVPADKSDFKLEIKLPASFAVGDSPGVRLFATIKPDAKNAAIIVRSADVPVSLNVLPAEVAKKDAK